MAEEVLDEEQDEQECPKCPPAGAPAWMATFADMATLLMAFFVLILSFAEFNVPKFKQISGSLKEAFGVQKVVPVVEQPKGTTVIALEFSPNPSPSISETLRQDTTELQPGFVRKAGCLLSVQPLTRISGSQVTTSWTLMRLSCLHLLPTGTSQMLSCHTSG